MGAADTGSTRVVIVRGDGPHTDQWHALEDTSAAIARVLQESADWAVDVVGTDELTAESLTDAALVIVDASSNLDLEPGSSSAVVDLLVASVAGGRALLGVHSSSIAFRDDPRWAETLGGRWIRGVSWHPPIGAADVVLTSAGSALFGVTDFTTHDERYTDLEVASDVEVLAFHREADAEYPLVWSCPTAAGKVGYSALGHGVESYESPGHRAMLVALVRWLIG